MEIHIVGHDLPGRDFSCDGSERDNVHVAVQVGKEPNGLVAGDAPDASWTIEVRPVETPDGLDLRGPAVHGRRGERFLYLTWGQVSSDGGFEMFRRAKLMIGDIDAGLLRDAAAAGGTRAHGHRRPQRRARTSAVRTSQGAGRRLAAHRALTLGTPHRAGHYSPRSAEGVSCGSGSSGPSRR